MPPSAKSRRRGELRDSSAVKKKKEPPKNMSNRFSPCVLECRRQWCDGYNADYLDGEADGLDDSRKRGIP